MSKELDVFDQTSNALHAQLTEIHKKLAALAAQRDAYLAEAAKAKPGVVIKVPVAQIKGH